MYTLLMVMAGILLGIVIFFVFLKSIVEQDYEAEKWKIHEIKKVSKNVLSAIIKWIAVVILSIFFSVLFGNLILRFILLTGINGISIAFIFGELYLCSKLRKAKKSSEEEKYSQ